LDVVYFTSKANIEKMENDLDFLQKLEQGVEE
jgi:hypothetical protein